MATQAGELVVRIVASDGGTLKRDVEQQVNGAAQGAVAASGRTMSQIGAQASQLGTKMSLAATLPLVAIGKSAVDAASATTEAVNKVGVVFGDGAAEVLAFADTSAKAFGISKQEALAAAGTFGNLFRAMGVGEKQAAKVSTSMTGLAGDLASFNDADPSEVLQALQSGLLGEAEPMRRFGVQLSDARVQAEAFATGLVKPVKNAAEITKANLAVESSIKALSDAEREHGTDSLEARKAQVALTDAQTKLNEATKGAVPPLTDAQKLQARQSIIMKDTALAQGDFQRSLSSSAANQQRVSKALAADSQAAIGQQILPLYQQAVVQVGKVAEAFGNLSPEGQKTVVMAAGITAAMGPVLSVFGNIAKVGTGAGKGVMAVGKGASATVGAAKRLGQGYRDAQTAQSAFSGSAGTIGGKLKTAQTALVSGAKSAGVWAATMVRSAATATAALVRAAAQQIAALVRIGAAYVAQGARAAASMAATAARVVAGWLLMAAQSLLAAARMALAWIIAMGPIALVIAAVVALAVLIIKNWDTIKAATVAAFNAVVGFVVSAWGRIKAAVSAAVSFVIGFVKSHWLLLVTIITGPLGLIVGLVVKHWAQIRQAIASALNAVRAVVSSVIGFVVGIISRGVGLWLAGFNRARAGMVAAASAVRSGVTSAFNALVGAVSGALGRVVSAVTGVKDRIIGAVSGAATWLLDAGRNIVQGLINGITELAGAAVQKIKDTASDMISAATGVLGIFSPSRVFREIGEYVIKGLVQGLTGDADTVVAASEKLADMVTEAYKKRAKANEVKDKDGKVVRKAGLTKSEAAKQKALLALIKQQRASQVDLAKQHSKLLTQLAGARENLAALQEQSRQYAADVTKALVDSANITSAMPEGVAVTAQTLTDRLRKQVQDARAFAANVAKLAASGLNQTAIDQIVQAGVDGGSLVAQELAAATPEQIAELNALQQQLTEQGQTIGQSAADELYAAGIRGAQGIVRGLENDEARMTKVMTRQAQVFANQVRAGLGLALQDFNGKAKGLYDAAPAAPGKPGGGAAVAPVGTGGKGNLTYSNKPKPATYVNTVVNNPKPERASTSVPKRLRRLQQSGALK